MQSIKKTLKKIWRKIFPANPAKPARAPKGRRATRGRARASGIADIAAALMSGGGGMVYAVGPDGDGMVRGGYDLARTTDGNAKHWARADGLSAEAANSL